MAFADLVYSLTADFSVNERFGLTSQMRRACVSVASNIARGSGHVTNSDFGRSIEFAYGALMEVVTQAEIAKRQNFLSAENNETLKEKAEEIARMLSGLRSTLLN